MTFRRTAQSGIRIVGVACRDVSGALDGRAVGALRKSIRMPKTAYRPLINPKLRTSVPRKAIRDAVRKLAMLRKTNPAEYRALLEKHANTTIRIVPG
jgi:hypothetical protein